jgi:5-oxoprolinase (ATP-hydrolysing) subunit C
MTLLSRDHDLTRDLTRDLARDLEQEHSPASLPTRFAQVKSPGMLTTVQDLGRFGQRRYGISVCGALEGDHLRLANAAVGNGSNAAALELSGGQVRLEFAQPIWACWFGSGFASLEVGKPQYITSFESIGRGILALSGGIDVPPIHGSRATDLRAGFGGLQGRALKRGDLLPLGLPSTIAPKSALHWRIPPYKLEGLSIRAVRGPEWDALSPSTQATLEQVPFKVSALSNRMGLRLEGAALEVHRHNLIQGSSQGSSHGSNHGSSHGSNHNSSQGEMRSSAVLPGTVQLPLGGQPIVLLQDAGTVGGYPRILTISEVDLPRLAVLPPSTKVYLKLISSQEALRVLLERQRDLALFERNIQYRLGL